MADNDRGSNAPEPTAGLSTAASTGAVNNIASNRLSPPVTRTPPSKPTKSTLFFPDTLGNRSHSRNNSDAVDPLALASALKDYDEAGHRRERTPGTSPSRKRQRVYGDRSVYSLIWDFLCLTVLFSVVLSYLYSFYAQVYSKSRRSRPPGHVQLVGRGWLSINALKK